jgi:hypothetical protein
LRQNRGKIKSAPRPDVARVARQRNARFRLSTTASTHFDSGGKQMSEGSDRETGAGDLGRAFDQIKTAVRDLGDGVRHSGSLEKMKDALKDVIDAHDRGPAVDRLKATVREMGDDAGTSGALDRLKGAVTDFGNVAERSARDQWDAAKPELKSSAQDLQRVVESLSERAKDALDNLGNRLDPPDRRRS